MNKECSKLCINTSLRDAYSCLWRFKVNHLFISYLAFFPFTLVGLLGLLDPFFLPRTSLEMVPEGYNLAFILFIFTTYLWGIPCFILWHRLYLLGPEHLWRRKIWPILTRSFVMMFKVLFLIGICVMFALILMVTLSFTIELFAHDNSLNNFLELNDNEYFRNASIATLTGLLTYFLFLRFSLAICSRSIGKRMGLLTSWKLTEKNTFRMFCCFMAIFIPSIIASLISVTLYQLFFSIDLFYSDEILSAVNYMHIFVLAPVITLPLGALSSQCSSFYRHCGGEDYIKP